MNSEGLFYIGIKALITNRAGEVLLLLADTAHHRSPTEPYWDIPGGRMQEGQDIQQTLAREIYEEIGLRDFTVVRLLAPVLSKHRIPYEESRTAGLMLLVYEVMLDDSAKITISSEHLRYEWVARAEAKDRLSAKYPESFTQSL
ncbi:MAG TPA: NUDIX hydrolase [Candidatus Limnocylindrales bacterium]|nr:NUDIX hydrolase [Candidatus Limnocylindrales bacterium]